MDDTQTARERNKQIIADDQAGKARIASGLASAITAADEQQCGHLLRAMRKLAKSCGGVLPPAIDSVWREAQQSMTLAGSAGLSAPDEMLEVLQRLCTALRQTYHISRADRPVRIPAPSPKTKMRIFQPDTAAAEAATQPSRSDTNEPRAKDDRGATVRQPDGHDR